MKLHAQWIVGFVDGEGCFSVSISEKQVLPEFIVTQHERDLAVLYALKAYFKVGVVRKNNQNCYCYRVRAFSDLKDTIVPFFEKHKL